MIDLTKIIVKRNGASVPLSVWCEPRMDGKNFVIRVLETVREDVFPQLVEQGIVAAKQDSEWWAVHTFDTKQEAQSFKSDTKVWGGSFEDKVNLLVSRFTNLLRIYFADKDMPSKLCKFESASFFANEMKQVTETDPNVYPVACYKAAKAIHLEEAAKNNEEVGDPAWLQAEFDLLTPEQQALVGGAA